MALGPESLQKEFQNKIAQFEKEIDNSLAKSDLNNGVIHIDVPRGMRSNHYSILELRYIEAGWKSIEWHSDQREGDWLTFKY